MQTGTRQPRAAPCGRGTRLRPRRWGVNRLIWFGMAVCSLLMAARADAQVSREYQLKAVFLYHFAQFTEWPTNAFAATNSPIVIGILGVDPFGSVLDSVVTNEVVNGRRIVVERFSRVEDIKTCHILFIAASEARILPRIIQALQDRPILIVSEIEESATRRGVMVRMFTADNRIRLRVNLNAVSSAHLTLSSKLLRAAEVFPKEDP